MGHKAVVTLEKSKKYRDLARKGKVALKRSPQMRVLSPSETRKEKGK